MIEKILSKLEEGLNETVIYDDDDYFLGMSRAFREAIAIVQEVAKEYGNGDLISRSVLLDKLQKWKFANEERGYDTASDLVQEMIDLVKEQPLAPYQKGE